MNKTENFETLVLNHAIDGLEALQDSQIYGCDLHNELFNTDYFVIYTYQATEILKNYGTFDAIDEVIKYEKDNFGQTNTNIDAVSICNMLAYIKGEDLLQTSKTLQDNWGNYLSDEDIKQIIIELKE